MAARNIRAATMAARIKRANSKKTTSRSYRAHNPAVEIAVHAGTKQHRVNAPKTW